MYIDTHCQLNFADFDPDRAMVIGNAKKAGVKKFIVPGVDHLSIRTALLLAKHHEGIVYAAAGFHPYEAQHNPDVSFVESLLKDKENQPYLVAVGECGLDYHLYKGELAAGRKDIQMQLLKDQLQLAVTYNLPVILHCREAFSDMFTVLDSLETIPRGVFHCFSGSLQDLRIAVDMGFYIGVDGNVTYSKHLLLSVPEIPHDRLLLETDAPYLTPVPHKGERNEPKYIPLIASKIAELQHRPVLEIETQTTENAKTLFGI